MPVTLKGVLCVRGLLLVLPATKHTTMGRSGRNAVRVQGNLGKGLARLDSAQHLLLKLFGKDTAFETDSQWYLGVCYLNALSYFKGTVYATTMTFAIYC